MPELPEVETVRLSIRPDIIGCQIEKIEILTPGIWLGEHTDLSGYRIEDLQRRGKYLVFILSKGSTRALLAVHLRMTGRLLLRKQDQLIEKHTHFRMILVNQGQAEVIGRLWLDFVDPRRFGRVWQLAETEEARPQGLAKLGPEPLDDQFNAEMLTDRLAGRKARLKALLLDQTVIAGLGNIYADESLFASSLHPARRACTLTFHEIERLTLAIRDVLGRAIACNGTTLRDYADGWNRRGQFQDCLMVYGRAGQPCRVCGTTIKRIRLAGRSTCWCPSCQPEISGLEATP